MNKRIQENIQLGQAFTAAIQKLDEYHTLATSQRESHSTIATICDPRYLMNVFKKYWVGNDEPRFRRARKQWEECFFDILNGRIIYNLLLLIKILLWQ
jgi:hypothetical protein